MSESECETAHRRSETIVLCDPVQGFSRRLVMRPKGFFATRFDMAVEDVGAPHADTSPAGNAFGAILQFVALIGVSALLYTM